MKPTAFENVALKQINQQMALERRFNMDLKSRRKEKQTSMSEFL
jgi:hypothetical protein